MRLDHLLSIAAISIVSFGVSGCNRSAAEEKGKTELPLISVTTDTVGEVEAPVTLRISGTLRGLQETDLAANATGRVTSTSVERGAEVKAGQVLAQLDVRAAAISASEANAMAESARAAAAQAKLECSRAEPLKTSGSISQAEYDRLAANCRTSTLGVEASSARARMAAQNVGDGSVRAPFAGVVTDRYVDVGEFVRADSRVVTIVSTETLRLEFSVPEAQASKVKAGAEVTFRVATFPGRRFTGTLRFVSGAIRPTTRDLVAEALVDNSDKALLPGMFADIELTTGTRKLPALPKAAILDKDGRARAFFVVEGRLQERVLSTLPAVGEMVPVLKGAVAGDVVAEGDLKTFRNGQRTR